MSLSPDDHQYNAVEVPRRNEKVEQPYALAAVMLGVVVLLTVKLIARHWPMWPFWLAAALIASFAYNILIIIRPRLPLMALAVIGSELGMLLSMPMASLFIDMSDPAALPRLIANLISAGVVGAFAAWALSIHRYPTIVIAINFLLMFVIVGYGHVLLWWLR
ncbi:MAG: hypothetical protein ACYDCO_10620 [Armatimonadota bacterium]